MAAEKIKQYLDKIEGSTFREGSNCRAYFFDKYVLKVAKKKGARDQSLDEKKTEILILEKAIRESNQEGANFPEIIEHYFTDDTAIWLEEKVEGQPMFLESVHNIATQMGLDISKYEEGQSDPFLYSLPPTLRKEVARESIVYNYNNQTRLMHLSDNEVQKYLWSIHVANKHPKIQPDLFCENVILGNGLNIIDLQDGQKSINNLFNDLTLAVDPFSSVVDPVDNTLTTEVLDLIDRDGVKKLQNRNARIIDRMLQHFETIGTQQRVSEYRFVLFRNSLRNTTGSDEVLKRFLKRYSTKSELEFVNAAGKVVSRL